MFPEAPSANDAASADGIITPRLMLQLMLESLLDALAEPEEPEDPPARTANGEDNLDESAELLILGYAVEGVDPDLLPEDAADALETADDAELMLAVQDLGLPPSLEADLLTTLHLMQIDLEALQQ